MPLPATRTQVLVVGGGNTACIAALSALEAGASSVVMIEAAPKAERGGNSRFAGTAWRFVHKGKDHLMPLLDNEATKEADMVRMGPYTAEDFTKDMLDKSGGRHDREEIKTIIEHGYDTMKWMANKGVPFILPVSFWFSREGATGVQELPPGVPVVNRNSGRGLTDAMWAAVERINVQVYYETPAHDLLMDGDRVLGVRARTKDGYRDFIADNVILACGGFEANPRMRRLYLGQGTEFAIVRGTRFNTGIMLERAFEKGAMPNAHIGGYHCAPLDINSPKMGDMSVLDIWERYSFSYAIMVNSNGERFVDEGEDEVSLVYSKMGAAVANQPGAKAWQIFDQKVVHLIGDKYKHAEKIEANTIEELAQMIGLNPVKLVKTVEAFNAATTSDKPFDAYRNDGLATAKGYHPVKSNWALPINKGPFVCYAITVGITFTFGGIKTNQNGEVLNNEGRIMPHLYAMGEITGGFYYGYAAGASLIRSSVMARIAGKHAATNAKPGKLTARL